MWVCFVALFLGKQRISWSLEDLSSPPKFNNIQFVVEVRVKVATIVEIL